MSVTTDSLSQLLAETPYPLAAFCADENVNTATGWRWWKKGVRGVKLETYLRGATRMTTREAVARWKAATTAAGAQPDPPVQELPALHVASGDEANRILDAAGISG